MAISDGRFINLEFQGLFLHGFSHQKKRGSGPHLSFTVISAAKDLTDRQTTDICHATKTTTRCNCKLQFMSELIPVLNLREEPSKDKEDRGYVIHSLLFHVFVDPLSEMSVSKIAAFGSTALHIPRDEALYILLFVYTFCGVLFPRTFWHVFPAMCAYTQKDSLPPREWEWERLLHFCYYFSLFFFSCQGRLFPLLLCCRGWLGCMSPGKSPYTSSSLQSSSSPPLSAILARSVSHFCFATKIAKEGEGKQRKSGRKELASPLLHSPTFATTLPCISFKISSSRDEEKKPPFVFLSFLF